MTLVRLFKGNRFKIISALLSLLVLLAAIPGMNNSLAQGGSDVTVSDTGATYLVENSYVFFNVSKSPTSNCINVTYGRKLSASSYMLEGFMLLPMGDASLTLVHQFDEDNRTVVVFSGTTTDFNETLALAVFWESFYSVIFVKFNYTGAASYTPGYVDVFAFAGGIGQAANNKLVLPRVTSLDGESIVASTYVYPDPDEEVLVPAVSLTNGTETVTIGRVNFTGFSRFLVRVFDGKPNVRFYLDVWNGTDYTYQPLTLNPNEVFNYTLAACIAPDDAAGALELWMSYAYPETAIPPSYLRYGYLFVPYLDSKVLSTIAALRPDFVVTGNETIDVAALHALGVKVLYELSVLGVENGTLVTVYPDGSYEPSALGSWLVFDASGDPVTYAYRGKAMVAMDIRASGWRDNLTNRASNVLSLGFDGIVLRELKTVVNCSSTLHTHDVCYFDALMDFVEDLYQQVKAAGLDRSLVLEAAAPTLDFVTAGDAFLWDGYYGKITATVPPSYTEEAASEVERASSYLKLTNRIVYTLSYAGTEEDALSYVYEAAKYAFNPYATYANVSLPDYVYAIWTLTIVKGSGEEATDELTFRGTRVVVTKVGTPQMRVVLPMSLFDGGVHQVLLNSTAMKLVVDGKTYDLFPVNATALVLSYSISGVDFSLLLTAHEGYNSTTFLYTHRNKPLRAFINDTHIEESTEVEFAVQSPAWRQVDSWIKVKTSHSEGGGPRVYAWYFSWTNISIALSKAEGYVGDLVYVYGENATPNSMVLIYWDGNNVANVTANGAGAFTVELDVPETYAGYHNITAVDVGTGAQCAAKFKVLPKIVIQPSYATPKEKVTIYGTGFAPNTSVNILFENMPVALAYTNGKGSFYASFIVPDVLSDIYTIRALDSEGNMAETELAVLPVIPSLPSLALLVLGIAVALVSRRGRN